MCLLISNQNGLYRNEVESKWAGIGMRYGNQNKLFTLAVGIEIEINCIDIDVFILFWNRNG